MTTAFNGSPNPHPYPTPSPASLVSDARPVVRPAQHAASGAGSPPSHSRALRAGCLTPTRRFSSPIPNVLLVATDAHVATSHQPGEVVRAGVLAAWSDATGLMAGAAYRHGRIALDVCGDDERWTTEVVAGGRNPTVAASSSHEEGCYGLIAVVDDAA